MLPPQIQMHENRLLHLFIYLFQQQQQQPPKSSAEMSANPDL